MSTGLANIQNQTIKYTDGKDTWEALPGQPNGTFQIPGFPEFYSVSSLYDMLRKHCRIASIVSGAQIQDLGTVGVEDALQVMGELVPQREAPVTGKKPTKASQDRVTVVNWFKTTNAKKVTKKQISEGTDIPLPRLSALLTSTPEIEMVGKDGVTNMYSLRNKR